MSETGGDEGGRGGAAPGPVDRGPYAGPPQRRLPAETVALVLGIGWVAVAGGIVLVTGGGPDSGVDAARLLLTAMVIVMPAMLFWIGAVAARSERVMREESRHVRAAIDSLRHSMTQSSAARPAAPDPARMEQKLDEIAAAQKTAESAIATFDPSRPRERAAQAPASAVDEEPGAGQGALELDTAAATPPQLSQAEVIRALHFPETEQDSAGFQALRRALAHPPTARLVRAAEDVLTLLSQDGIYMDDLSPDRARPGIWRRFAAGARGAEIAALGGVRDRACLTRAADRMREDMIFRDAAHHFLREFDRGASAFVADADDAAIAAFAETRTARAFMLLGRVAGTFD